MQQITNTHAAKVKSPVLSLAISWLIILGTYFLLRLIFIIFGFHLYAGLLGGCLAFVPYLISTIYLYKSTRTTNIWIYLLGIALPNIIEKIVLYLMGAFLYGVDPANVSSALQRIASNEPYTNFFTHPAAPNIFSLPTGIELYKYDGDGLLAFPVNVTLGAAEPIEAQNSLVILVNTPSETLKIDTCLLPLISSGNILFADVNEVQATFEESKLKDYGTVQELNSTH